VRLPDDALSAVWTIYDATGIRPEYLLPVLWQESGFNPGLQNLAGAPYYGIAQTGGGYIVLDLHTTPEAFLASGAAAQLTSAVLPHMRAIVHRYGRVRSATRAYQANFLPDTLRTATALGQIVAPYSINPKSWYQSNRPIDHLGHRAITVADLAWWMARASRSGEVRDAVARAYEMRPEEGPPHEAVYGEDFLNPLAVGLLAGALAVTLGR